MQLQQTHSRPRLAPGARLGVGVAVAAILGLVPQHRALAQSASAAELSQLKEQVDALQRQLQRLEQAQQAQPAAPAAAGTTAPTAAKKEPPHLAQSGSGKFSLESADGQTSIALTGRLHLDVGGYTSFKPDNAAVGTQVLSSGFNARRARIGVNGKVGGVWSYQFIYDGGNSADNNPAGVQWAQIAYVGFKGVQIDLPGYSEVPFTLEYAESSNDTLFIERAVPVNVAAGLGTGDFRSNTGVRFYGDRYWFGAFLTGPQYGDSHANVRERLGAFQRAGYQVLAGENYSLHVGGGVSELFKVPDSFNTATPPVRQAPSLTLSDRPELRIDPTSLFSTGAIGNATNPATGATVYNVELAGQWHGLFAQGEYFHYDIERRGLSNNGMDGAYGELGWVLTGEHRRYTPVSGGYSGVNPAHRWIATAAGGRGRSQPATATPT